MTAASTPTMPRHRLSLALTTLLSLSVSGLASASDWYARIALGQESSQGADFSDRDCSSQQPAALFGCVHGDDGRPIGAYGDFGSYPVMEIAVGKRLLPWLRSELAVGYRPDVEYRGNANFLTVGRIEPVSADLESWNGMVNAYVDLATATGTDLGRFQPYVGVGAGIAYNRIGKMTYLFPENPYRHKISIVPAGERTNFAYRLAVGTGFRLTQTLTLDLSAYYIDLGEVGTDTGLMAMNHVPAGILIDETETELRAFGLSLGLRYQF